MQYLMERLVNDTDPDTGRVQPFDLAGAVAAQLQRIVMCRPDVAARSVQLNDFGVPILVDLGPGRRDLEHYAERLAQAIARHEPRLRDVRLDWGEEGRAPSPRTLVVSGRLAGAPEQRTFSLDLPVAAAVRG